MCSSSARQPQLLINALTVQVDLAVGQVSDYATNRDLAELPSQEPLARCIFRLPFGVE